MRGYKYLVYGTIYSVGINNVVINGCINVKVTNSTQLTSALYVFILVVRLE